MIDPPLMYRAPRALSAAELGALSHGLRSDFPSLDGRSIVASRLIHFSLGDRQTADALRAEVAEEINKPIEGLGNGLRVLVEMPDAGLIHLASDRDAYAVWACIAKDR